MALRVLTGITTTGTPHLGNYVGAIRPAVAASRRAEVASFYFLADYHALIKCDDPLRIQRSRLEIAASWLAAGLDPDKVTFYRQSDIPEIPELTWLLTCVTAKGLMNRAHAYKAAVDANLAAGEDADAGVTMGLYSYPILMAADILMFARKQSGFDAMRVPVGRDQVQHIEMARDVAARFNHLFGAGRDCFALPEAAIEEQVATLPGLDGRKMSKSYDNTIPLFAGGAGRLRESILRIVTDSKAPGEPKDAESSHLFAIYRAFAGADEAAAFRRELEGGLAWGEAKQRLFERIDAELAPMRARYEALIARPADIEDILQAGAKKARALATPFLAELRAAVGLRSMRELAAPAAQKPKKKGAKGARFVSFREKDGHFHFRFLAADGEELLLSVPFEDPQAAGEWIRVLQKSGGAASFAWGPGDLEIRKTEHVGGHAYELWYGRERLAEGGPRAEPAARDAAVDKLVAEMEALWQQAGEG
ncbi:MAG: tryptophan--tRNA ligase [Mizugakiibacter sp.]|uniref:tryptophan--tRNA ligase n=1 Tax=Mizugakiibacter sp. TaxID=1972610 RepID=UPI0031CB0EDE|nr:tryptophan--tRNA ligase [Xanthomonadaceae bacterium]